MRCVAPDSAGLGAAAEVLHSGGVVAYPTETVYGLGVDPFNLAALEALYAAKGRSDDKGLIVIVADNGQLEGVVGAISAAGRALMEAFWPGPLSLIVPKAAGLPSEVTGGSANVCVRCPGSETARQLCRVFGGAVTSTSANLSGGTPAVLFEELGSLKGVALAIDGGILPEASPSTVYDTVNNRVLRPGLIDEGELRKVVERF